MELSSPTLIALNATATLSDADACINRMPADQARGTSHYVFRVDETFVTTAAHPSAKASRDAVLTRAVEKPILLLTYSEAENAHHLYNLNSGGVDIASEAEYLEGVRAADLRNLVTAAGQNCILTSGHGHHFVTPALVHCTKFLRIGDVIRSVEALDTMTFWLRPILQTADAVLCDTWSIATIALGALRLIGRDIPFDCLTGHPKQDKDGVRRGMEEFLRRIASDSSVVFIISVTSTGTLVESIKAIMAEIGLSEINLNPIGLYAFANSSDTVPALCRLSERVENYASIEDCDLCKENSVRVRVDPHLYYIHSRDETQVGLRPELFKSGRRFLDQFGHIKGVLRSHRDDPNDQRHHAFDVDVATLLENQQFVDDFKKSLSELAAKPDIIVTPDHATGRTMATIASETLGSPHIVHNDLRRVTMDHATQIIVAQARRILIVDDVVNSGGRLERYNTSLREEYAGSFDELSFVVGLARPQSIAEWRRVGNSLTTNHPWHGTLSAVATLFLPRWDASQCPGVMNMTCYHKPQEVRLSRPLGLLIGFWC